MKMTILLISVVIFLTVLIPVGHGAGNCVADAFEPEIVHTFNGTRQSPINIITATVKENASLTDFKFTGFSTNSTMGTIENTGDTVRVNLNEGLVKIGDGGLSSTYDTLQFHLHWGNGSGSPGSEHTVDGKQYPMELHMVNIKSEFKGNTTLALNDPEGIAALGFFIEVRNDTGLPKSWKTLTSYLHNITSKCDKINITHQLSLEDILEGVNRTNYYRYLGSLTTKDFNELVVWTVFKEPIRVSKDLIDLFATTVQTGNSSSPLMINTFRKTQDLNSRVVTTQGSNAVSLKPSHAFFLLSFSLAYYISSGNDGKSLAV